MAASPIDYFVPKQDRCFQGFDVSVTGGWCEYASDPANMHHRFDAGMAAALAVLFANRTVASFGDGPGDYKRHMDDSEMLKGE